MMLRRYHSPIEESESPELEPGTLAQTDQSAEDAALANAQVTAAEQQEQADAANADDTGAQSVAPIIQEAGGVEDNPANDPTTVPVAAEPAPDAGNVDVVTADDLHVVEPVVMDDTVERREAAEEAGLHRNSSTEDWRSFASTRGYLGFEDAKRDDLAEFYLGAK